MASKARHLLTDKRNEKTALIKYYTQQKNNEEFDDDTLQYYFGLLTATEIFIKELQCMIDAIEDEEIAKENSITGGN
jgi:hypothetical protein